MGAVLCRHPREDPATVSPAAGLLVVNGSQLGRPLPGTAARSQRKLPCTSHTPPNGRPGGDGKAAPASHRGIPSFVGSAETLVVTVSQPHSPLPRPPTA